MSPTTTTCVLLLLMYQAIGSCGQGYASQQDLSDLKNELEGDIADINAEWEREQQSIDNEMSFWQRAFLSLVKMLHRASSGTNLLQYWTQQEEAFKEVEDTINDLKEYIDIGTRRKPAPSCKDLLPNSTSGWYWLRNPQGIVSEQYCDMEREGCGTRGGWLRVAHVDMTQPDQQCPPGLTTITTYNTTKRLCGRPGPRGCVSTIFSSNAIPYNFVCGKVIGYQHRTTDGPCPYTYSHRTIDGPYMDGVSLTHGSPRQHIWSFIANHGENSVYSCTACSCFNGYAGVNIPFIGNDYFCDTGSETSAVFIFYYDDPLWDGQGCGPDSGCCTFNNPPWFCKQLPQQTTDDLEFRICGNEDTSNEDAPIEHIELYIQ